MFDTDLNDLLLITGPLERVNLGDSFSWGILSKDEHKFLQENWGNVKADVIEGVNLLFPLHVNFADRLCLYSPYGKRIS